jgi:glycosyltransferase involved in cell wall biosynthesis
MKPIGETFHDASAAVESVETLAVSGQTADLAAESKRISTALSVVTSADECLILAQQSEDISAFELRRVCLERAVTLDRNCQAALLMLAATSLDDEERLSTAVLLEEAARVAPLPEMVKPLHAELIAEYGTDDRLANFYSVVGRVAAAAPEKCLSIVIVTNLFPPQELGGYGRMMWEFAHGLRMRGHTVRVLTSNLPEFAKKPTADEVTMETHVLRSLKLLGTWVGGRAVPLTEQREIARRVRDNHSRVRTIIGKLDADLVLAGNLDFLGSSILRPALDGNIPVLHALANAAPGYGTAEQPAEAHYWVAPCSDWNGEVFWEGGFTRSRMETVYPGARIDRFFRFFLPDRRRLRICYASLVLPYKGVDTLILALAQLHAAGVDFTAEIAGEAPDSVFLAQQQKLVEEGGFRTKVTFTGFLNRDQLGALFARNNVLVFPSRFQEPFGISQVEALAAGLVVVSSGTGGAKEIIRDGIDGLLFDAGDHQDLASKLLTLAGDDSLMAQLQTQGQARATAFSVEKSVLRIESLAAEMQAGIDSLQAAELRELA